MIADTLPTRRYEATNGQGERWTARLREHDGIAVFIYREETSPISDPWAGPFWSFEEAEAALVDRGWKLRRIEGVKSKELDRLAAGPEPDPRVLAPRTGERCHRCHRRRSVPSAPPAPVSPSAHPR